MSDTANCEGCSTLCYRRELVGAGGKLLCIHCMKAERDTLAARVKELEAALADMTASAEYWRTCGGRGKVERLIPTSQQGKETI